MSKKKNTLSDLNDFLKQKPNMLVAVEKLEDRPDEIENIGEIRQTNNSVKSIIQNIQEVAFDRKEDIRLVLFEIIKTAIENQQEVNASDLMLLNTVHYLEHTEKLNVKLKELSE